MTPSTAPWRAHFGKPRRHRLAWKTLNPVQRTRAAIAWHFGGRETSISKLLSTLDQRIVIIGRRERWLDWWMVGEDAGLLFDLDRIVGHAVQFGFVCYELPLWKAISTASGLPEMFSWKLDEGDDAAREATWKPRDVFDPGDVAAIIRDVEALRRRS